LASWSICETLGNSKDNRDSYRSHSSCNCPACEALGLLMLSVAIPYSDLAAYECQSFRCGYDFIWRKRRVRLDFHEIVLTSPQVCFRKDTDTDDLHFFDH